MLVRTESRGTARVSSGDRENSRIRGGESKGHELGTPVGTMAHLNWPLWKK